ncbi:hypothetical protein [Desulfobacula sp.]|uniref:hypothetical protein n=1 Tax=Desulfobacula sp. TaxID=2593537 RepID=UPI0026214B1E|nr:hypothetical protein [Desulfobacula sp.]
MLGFGKKKKKDTPASPEKTVPEIQEKKTRQDDSSTQTASVNTIPGGKKSSWRSKKRIFFVLLALVALGTLGMASYYGYALYVAAKDPDAGKAIYSPIELRHLNLPEEMVRFSFKYFPDLYDTMISFNTVMTLIDNEIARIDAIAHQYPDQKKIADKEKKIWEKEKKALEKAFIKIENPVKETYVLFRVNKEQGLVQINVIKKELTDLAHGALAPAQELTQNLKPIETVPQGFIKGTLYKLKKKFL